MNSDAKDKCLLEKLEMLEEQERIELAKPKKQPWEPKKKRKKK